MTVLPEKRYGEWALITGASAGIGEEFARRLALAGMNLILIARREDRLNQLAEEIHNRHGVQVVVAPLDLTQPDFLEKLLPYVEDRPIDILINNAGYGKNGAFLESDPVSEHQMVLLNCWAPVVLTRHFLPGMVERGKGALIMISSVVSAAPFPYFATYSATKVFDQYFGEGLYAEVGDKGVDILVVNPGPTKTEFWNIAGGAKNVGGMRDRTAKQVVDSALRALGKQYVVTDGRMNRIAMCAMRLLPRKLWLRTIKRMYDKAFGR